MMPAIGSGLSPGKGVFESFWTCRPRPCQDVRLGNIATMPGLRIGRV
jgi:hypothetical protein